MSQNSPDVRKFFAAQLVKLREDRRMTQKELGDLVGYTDAAVGMWENAKRLPDANTIKKIAGIFKVTVDDLLGPASKKTTGTLDDEWPEIAQILRRKGKKITEEERRRIIRIMKAAVEDTED